jgi:hypothetical protein
VEVRAQWGIRVSPGRRNARLWTSGTIEGELFGNLRDPHVPERRLVMVGVIVPLAFSATIARA